MRPRGFEYRAFSCPVAEERRRLFGEAGLPDVDGRDVLLPSAASPTLETAGSVVGYAATFGTLSTDLGGFVERIAPGSFSRSLRSGRDARFLVQHDPRLILGRQGNGSLRLQEDAVGLAFELSLPKTDVGFDTLRNVKRADLYEMSFGFITPENGDEWKREGGRLVRILHDVELLEVSAVTWAAYPRTVLLPGDPASARARRLAELDRLVAEDERRRQAEARERKLKLRERELSLYEASR